MATHKSAIKRASQSEARRQRNRAVKTKVKKAVRKVQEAVDKNNKKEAQAALAEAIPVIDRAASKRTLHHRTAARKISRLSKKVHALSKEEE